jgi:hypothetical protein
LAVCAAGLLLLAACGDGADLEASGGSAAPGEGDTQPGPMVDLLLSTGTIDDRGRPEVCVESMAGGQHIAGVQADLQWEDECATFAECRAAPGLRPSWFAAQPRPATLRAVVISLDVEPIPDGALYCCSFEIFAGSPCCPVVLTAALASGPEGNPVAVPDAEGLLCPP